MKQFLQRILQENMKKKLGTSDALLMSRLSQPTIDPFYYVYWRLLGFKSCGKLSHIFVISKDWNFAQKND